MKQQITSLYSFRKIFSAIFLITCISVLGSTSCFAQPSKNNKLEGKWFVDFIHNDIGQARTVIEFNTKYNTFVAYTRKNADKDILGNWTSFLGRAFTKSLKNGSIIRIERGIFRDTGDTILLAGIMVTPMGNFNFNGHIANNKLYASLRNKSRGYTGTVSGNRTIPQLPLEDYSALFQNVVSETESKIFNKEMLQSKEWKAFYEKMQATTPKIQDDLEMIFAFFYRAGKLPFSHFALMKPIMENEEINASQKRYLVLEEKNEKTAYLKISSFIGTAKEVDSIFGIICQKNYKHLIVDLRNNSGGNVEAGIAFASSVIDTPTFGGVFLTQKWFNAHNTLPVTGDYEKFPHFTEANFNLIIEGIHQTEGLCLKINPKKEVYQGNLYILTNRNTASTCEPIVYELQKQKIALIIGETTAGAMLNGEMFTLSKGFKLFIPTADYYTSDGFKIDQNGVKPDIETKSDDALEVIMEKLNGQ